MPKLSAGMVLFILIASFIAWATYMEPGCLFGGPCAVTSDQDKLYEEQMREWRRGR